jgi:hypothetical protein
MWDSHFDGLILVGVAIGVVLTLSVAVLGWAAWYVLHHLAWVTP